MQSLRLRSLPCQRHCRRPQIMLALIPLLLCTYHISGILISRYQAPSRPAGEQMALGHPDLTVNQAAAISADCRRESALLASQLRAPCSSTNVSISQVLRVFISSAHSRDAAQGARNLDFFLTFGRPLGQTGIADPCKAMSATTVFVLRPAVALAMASELSSFGDAILLHSAQANLVGSLAVLRGLAQVVEYFGGVSSIQHRFTAVAVVTDEAHGPYVPVYLRYLPGTSWAELLAFQLRNVEGGVHLVACR
jgi:hypothetical protein